ncbi:galactose-binding like protein [Vararia minispora EC-137]|uniref:Galactose-binding like protein n=1 Tax=Vararia minispora EC-137 TaxID=1314806 RepID=A0ACB8QHF3_9AGAM|nr:galactose-binding like protein [Vararia minispora EC-137]
MTDLSSLITPDTRIRVSSTLNKSVGKKFLTDGSAETCWTSQQGSPQYIQLLFTASVIPRRISLTFQGGFVGTKCVVEVQQREEGGWMNAARLYPEDVNRKQVFDIDWPNEIVGLKLIFEESSDFFGRIAVYDLGVGGIIPL